jgi:hypothetical protein
MMSSDLVKRLAALAVLGIGLSACSALGSSVAEDDPETEVPNVSMGRALMEGLGAVPSRRTPIKYTPRAPLVVPPTTTALAPPEDPNQVAALAEWPDDPDVAAQRRLREAAARDAGRDRADPLPSSELLADRIPTDRSDRGPRVGDRDPAQPIMPSELNKGFRSTGIDDTGVYDLNGQPRRRALVEPPVEYLQPAPGAPVAIPEEPKSNKGVLSWMKFW